MKKFVAVALALSIVGSTWAQGTFTIRRPVEGSTVREIVTLRIPKNSIPEGGYLGILVNGKFLEAVAPDVDGNDYIYKLDTKRRGIADGPMTVEAVLYVDNGTRPQIVNRSSVTVKVDNHTSIKIPANGLVMRYKFSPGREYIYTNYTQANVSMISQAAAQLGSRAAEIPVDAERVRVLYAVDNAYSTKTGREGLIRVQILPNKGKDYAMVTTRGETEPKKFMDYEMHPIYTRVTDTGREVWSSYPTYFPLDGTQGEAFRMDLSTIQTFPVLPTKGVKPGDRWQAAILQSNFDLEKRHETDKFNVALPGRGVFEGVEWQYGIPCAKIRTTLAVGQNDLQNLSNVNQQEGEAVKIQLEELTWFALDRGIVIRTETNRTQESLVTVGSGDLTGGGDGDGGSDGELGRNPGAAGAPGRGSRGGGSRGGSDAGRERGDDGGLLSLGQVLAKFGMQFHPHVNANGDFVLLRQAGTMAPPPSGGDAGGFGGAGAGGRSGGAGGGGVKQILRVRVQQVMELER